MSVKCSKMAPLSGQMRVKCSVTSAGHRLQLLLLLLAKKFLLLHFLFHFALQSQRFVTGTARHRSRGLQQCHRARNCYSCYSFKLNAITPVVDSRVRRRPVVAGQRVFFSRGWCGCLGRGTGGSMRQRNMTQRLGIGTEHIGIGTGFKCSQRFLFDAGSRL